MDTREIIQGALYPLGSRRSLNFIDANGSKYHACRKELTRGAFEFAIRFLHLIGGEEYKIYSDFIREDFICSLTDGGGDRYKFHMSLFLTNPPSDDDPNKDILVALLSAISTVYCEFHTNDETRIDTLLMVINRVFYFILAHLCWEDRSMAKMSRQMAYQEEFLISLLGPLRQGV